MIVVDTNVWSEATRRNPNVDVRRWAEANSDRLYLSAVVLAELRAGCAVMPPGKRREALETQIDVIAQRYADRILAFDEAASLNYGKVLASARSAGRPIQTADAMIAATALAHGFSVATRDLNDFAGAGVELINPWIS
jgi:predicted nucleic acid-binding protein